MLTRLVVERGENTIDHARVQAPVSDRRSCVVSALGPRSPAHEASEIEQDARLRVVGESTRSPSETAAPAVEAVHTAVVRGDVQAPSEERRTGSDFCGEPVAPDDVPAWAELHRIDRRLAPIPKRGEEQPVRHDGRARLDVSGSELPEDPSSGDAQRDHAAGPVLALSARRRAGPSDVDDPFSHGRRRGNAAVQLRRPDHGSVARAGGDDSPVVSPEDDAPLCDGWWHLDQAPAGDDMSNPKRRTEA